MEKWIIDNQHFKIVGCTLNFQKIKRGSVQMIALKEQFIHSIFNSKFITIENEVNGKPILKGSDWNVSVSHSNNWLFIQTTPLFQPGIDIEPLREKVLKIAPRFVNTIDEKNLQHWPQLLGLHVIWGAKEAIYKSYSKKGLDFKKEILIELPADHLESNQIKGSIIKGEKRQEFDLEWELFPDNELLVFITNASNPI